MALGVNNAIYIYFAIAHTMEIDLTLDDFEEVRKRTI